jgi:hypothetical protein
MVPGWYSKSSKLVPHCLVLAPSTTCRLLRYDLEASTVEIKDLKHKFDHSSRYTILSPL